MARKAKVVSYEGDKDNDIRKGHAKTAFQRAFLALGGVEALVRWARKNETEFYRLYSKLIPQEITTPPNQPFVLKHSFALESLRQLDDTAIAALYRETVAAPVPMPSEPDAHTH